MAAHGKSDRAGRVSCRGASGTGSAHAPGARALETTETWSQRYRRLVKPEECREIERNLAGFFHLLAEWESKIEPSE